ncbi:MAG: hypothetical protein KH446_09010 [Oscillibacter sp.]|uniref:hypothetical protein n=1 Tax=Oscillibacter sp. TaxID=1945593 RepID=UPI001D5FCB35|nr:hypothetical protein [Oscillibacter sp.]MBS6291834.1 hypothetical protein [Oscillibacter sp.]
MQEKKIEIENAKCSLSKIVSTFSLILEDIMEDQSSSGGEEVVFCNRMEKIYIPALDLILCATSDLLGRM